MRRVTGDRSADLDKQLDAILADGRIHLIPPGFMVFLAVNLLLMVAVAMWILVAQAVLFPGQTEKAAVFSVIAGLFLSVGIVTPAFLVLRGFANAMCYLQWVMGCLLGLLVISSGWYLVQNNAFNVFTGVGFVAVIVAFILVRSDRYQLLSHFTRRRRALAK